MLGICTSLANTAVTMLFPPHTTGKQEISKNIYLIVHRAAHT